MDDQTCGACAHWRDLKNSYGRCPMLQRIIGVAIEPAGLPLRSIDLLAPELFSCKHFKPKEQTMPDNPEPKDKKQPRRPKQLAWLDDTALLPNGPLIVGEEIKAGQILLPLCNHVSAIYGIKAGSYLPPGLSLVEQTALIGIPNTAGTFTFDWCAIVPNEDFVPLHLEQTITLVTCKLEDHIDLRIKGPACGPFPSPDVPQGFVRDTLYLSPQSTVKLAGILAGPSYHIVDDAELLALRRPIEDAIDKSDQVSVSVCISSIRTE